MTVHRLRPSAAPGLLPTMEARLRLCLGRRVEVEAPGLGVVRGELAEAGEGFVVVAGAGGSAARRWALRVEGIDSLRDLGPVLGGPVLGGPPPEPERRTATLVDDLRQAMLAREPLICYLRGGTRRDGRVEEVGEDHLVLGHLDAGMGARVIPFQALVAYVASSS